MDVGKTRSRGRDGVIKWILRACLAAVLVLGMIAGAGAQYSADAGFRRYFHSGNGVIDLVNAKTGAAFHGRYRNRDGSYDPVAVATIHEVFGAEYGKPAATVSLRLIEFLDLLEDRLRPGARILLTSGYRSPRYNKNLRAKGGIVAKASLHQYGMAADIIMEGVASRTVWTFVKDLQFGGAGYYHDQTIHIDVGPARFWTEKTSQVRTNISDQNKRIGLVSEFDRYRSGEVMSLRFIRMTAFPVAVGSGWVLQRAPGETAGAVMAFEPSVAGPGGGACRQFWSIGEMLGIHWTLPPALASGRYRICAEFCERAWDDMPAEACTPVFEITNQPRD